MARLEVSERARRYVATMDAAVSGAGGHDATFKVACALIHGFALSVEQARPLLEEYNQRCNPPWSASELQHKLVSASGVTSPQGYGYLLAADQRETAPGAGSLTEARRHGGQRAEAKDGAKDVAFDLEALRELAGEWAAKADLLYLANRSKLDPCEVTADGYLRAMYGPGEKVLVFTNQMSQGECLWPDEAAKLPLWGPDGVWYLAQPVDGKSRPNPRSVDKKTGQPKVSRRSAESVTAFRYLLLESDEAPARDWLGALVQMPLRIAAIYTSGGRSVHALVRVDCKTKAGWDAEKAALAPCLGLLRRAGMDRGALSAVRLTRLPGCVRGQRSVGSKSGSAGQRGVGVSHGGTKARSQRGVGEEGGQRDVGVSREGAKAQGQRDVGGNGGGGRLQKLLYLRPEAPLRPICELPPVRDVEAEWLGRAAGGIADSDETGGQWLFDALRYYANVSAPIKARLKELEACDE